MEKYEKTMILVLSIILLNLYVMGVIIEPRGKAILEVIYDKKVMADTTQDKRWWHTSPMTLRIGESYSMFFPSKLMAYDSLDNFNSGLALQLKRDVMKTKNNITYLLGWEKEYLYRNVIDNNTTILVDVAADCREYDEPTEIPAWEINDSTKVILGYECQLAKCSFRGRDWEAWFTTEIPLREGPWKLIGLPGLVLEANDSKDHYHFTAVGIRNENLGDVGYIYYGYFKPEKMSSRQKYQKWFYNYSMKAKFMGNNPYVKGKAKEQTVPKYDMEETDYPHE